MVEEQQDIVQHCCRSSWMNCLVVVAEDGADVAAGCGGDEGVGDAEGGCGGDGGDDWNEGRRRRLAFGDDAPCRRGRSDVDLHRWRMIRRRLDWSQHHRFR